MASEIKVDTISEKTSTNGVTIDSVSLKDGKVATANSIDSDAYVDASIDNAHLADDAVNTAEIADNAVTLAKMAGGTDGNIISYDASGDPVAIATGSDGQVLTSTGAGSPPAFEAASATWTKIKTVAVSGSTASVSFIHGTSDVVIDNTYSTYKVIMNGIAAHDGTGFKMYARIYDGDTDGTGTTLINSGTDYRYANQYADSNGTHTTAISNGASFMHLGTVQIVDNTTGEGFAGTFTAYNTEQVAADNCYKLFDWIGIVKENYVHAYHGGGVWIQQKTVRGFQFYPHAGTFTKGEFVLYGIT